MAFLIIETSGINQGRSTFEIQDEAIIGRDKSNPVFINDHIASRQHAKIIKEKDGNYHLMDLGSRNGTIVNGERVQSRRLFDKDRITIGRTVLIFSESRFSEIEVAKEPSLGAVSPQGEPVSVQKSLDKVSTVSSNSRTSTEPACADLSVASATQTGASAARPATQIGAEVKKLVADLSAKEVVPPEKQHRPRPKVSAVEITEQGEPLGKRILVFLVMVIFFVTVILLAKWGGEKLMERLAKSRQEKKVNLIPTKASEQNSR
jgi:pSer/pThr/pTyr-binding forkhead associated (FHA) protein